MGPVVCKKCGANMQPDATARLYTCHFCNDVQQVGVGAEQIAQGMALDLANTDRFLAQLANTLSQGFAECTRIEAQMLNGVNVPVVIEVHLEPDVFMAQRNGQHAVCTHKKIVRGVALRTQEMAIDLWVDKLLDALALKANESARAAWVLGQLSGPGPK
jgi:hypothetical protein